MTQCRFYVDVARAPCVETAQSVTVLVGSYAARPSFGSYLELKSTVDLHAQIAPQRALLVLMPASTLQSQSDAGLGDAVIPVFFQCKDAEPSMAGHERLVDLPSVPPSTLIHLYGGGFINDWWGRPLRIATEALMTRHMSVLDRAARLFMSGQQVSATQEIQSWRPLFDRADYIGARDEESLRRALQAAGCRVHLSGDDALHALSAALQSRAEREPTIAAHINLADYSTITPDRRLSQMAKALAAAAGHFDLGLNCDLLVASTTSEGSGEEEAAQRLAEGYSRMVADGAARPLTFRVRNIFKEAVDGNLRMGGLLLLTCSYHVALAGLLSNCPTLLLVENDDYRQKAAGLWEIFTANFIGACAHEDVGAVVSSLIEKNRIRSSVNAAHRMWIGQIQKALNLSRLYCEMEIPEVRNRLDHVSSAFRDTAAQLGELRKRIILQERLAREFADCRFVNVVSSSERFKGYLAPYLGERTKIWLRRLRKQLERMTLR
jgi:hypothetical protein